MDTRISWAAPLLLLALVGCGERVVEVKATQPVQFSHKAHVSYFLSGRHKQEMVERHMTAGVFDKIEEAPEDLLQGNCATCHDLAAEKPDCARCHTIVIENPSIRERKEQRPCIVCHQGTWKGTMARIPSVELCASCHAEKARTDSVEETRLRRYIEARQDLPWTQIHTLAPSVYFSHPPHVRLGDIPCTRCHEDMTKKTVPPTSAHVFSMDACLSCHREKKASTDCIACHR